ncbi:hypothetical protein F4778DRAFT_81088 [Xylariomycetidae sp. FL2044]|nr:hypothetical protein F4778DRAFT_81088 [Xylariomycetidae sp. FL2044]
MGGLVFKGDGLDTPRMPPEVYKYVLETCKNRLRELLFVVASPIEGPGKKDFGDIDIFVAWEKVDAFAAAGVPRDPIAAAAAVLGAAKLKQEQPNVASMAIPWPTHCLLYDTEDVPSGKSDSPTPSRYIQVDIHYFSSISDLHWLLFKHAHADFWSILGLLIRPLGLTMDEQALWIRIPEVEKRNKRAAKILLTSRPLEILSFLGIDSTGSQWDQPFPTQQDLFEYIATCPFLYVNPNPQPASPKDDEKQVNTKSSERRRKNQRPAFRDWIEEFLPRCREQGRFSEERFSRDDIRELAFARFTQYEPDYFATEREHYFLGPRDEYYDRLRRFQIEENHTRIRDEVIKPWVYERHEEDWDRNAKGLANSALKKIILNDDESFGLVPPSKSSSLRREEDGLFDETKVRGYMDSFGEDVLQAALRKNGQKLHEKREKDARAAAQTLAAETGNGQGGDNTAGCSSAAAATTSTTSTTNGTFTGTRATTPANGSLTLTKTDVKSDRSGLAQGQE